MIPINNNGTITLTELRDRIKLELNIEESTKDDRYIDLKIMDAFRYIESYYNVEPACENLQICDYKAELPCNFKTMLGLVLNPGNPNSRPLMYVNNSSPLEIRNYMPASFLYAAMPINFKIVMPYIQFPSTLEASEVCLFYLKYASDESGFPLFRLGHEIYYTNYVCYHYYKRLGDKRFALYEYKGIRRNILHNEQAEIFRYDRENISKLIHFQTNFYKWG